MLTIIESRIPEDIVRRGIYYYARNKEDIDALMKDFPVTRLHYVGSDMATNFMRDTVDSMDEATFRRYLDYHFTICERPDMVGATHHMIDIFRKE